MKRTNYTENNIRINGDVCEMDLYDMKCNVKAKTIFSKKHLSKVRKYKWSYTEGLYVIHSKTGTLLHILISGCKKPMLADHINRDKLDNRDENIRLVTPSQNAINKSKQSNNTSGYTGVDYDKKNSCWKVRINIDRKMIWLGRYKSLEKAVEVRKKAEALHFGEYAPF